jgi:WD40 repeat protein
MNGLMSSLSLSPSRTVVTSFTPRKPALPDQVTAFEEGDWVLCTTADMSSSTVSCALSNGEVQVYDQAKLHRLHTFQGNIATSGSNHPTIINDLICGPQHTIVTADSDSQITVYDLRQGTAALRTSIPAGQSALSVSVGFDGYLAAVASNKARIHFMDLRQAGTSGNNVLGSYVDTHTDQVTQVHFHPTSTSTLLSASEDGLACIFDTTQPTEELSVKSVMNVGTPLRHVGFCGADLSSIYCLTGSETASLWHWDSSACRQDFGGNMLRERLAQSFGNNGNKGLAIDYLVDAHWDAVSQELMLMTGSAMGDAALFRLTERSQSTNFEPCHILQNGHRGVVRAWSPLASSSSSSSSTLITAGEDARLCEWNRQGSQGQTQAQQAQAPAVSTPAASSSTWVGGGRSLAPTPGGGGPVRPQKRHTSSQSARPY